ncbi:MAG: class I SAM-dependent methyltransferase [Campylobacterota bacterium]|nr:class I SAM-dependent methyltransferase [Campylobacterota bacterium]
MDNHFTKETSFSRFNILAKEWDSKPQRVESAMKFVEHIKGNVNKDIKSYHILDYGCGSGLVSFGFGNDVKLVTGLDYSIGMVERYNEKSKELNLSHLKAIKHNINEESLDSNKYDLIVTNMTMHHIKDISDFVYKLKDGLKKDGELYIADLSTEDGTFHSMGNEDVEHLGFKKEYIIDIFNDVGLKNIKYNILQTIKKEDNSYPIFVISGKK